MTTFRKLHLLGMLVALAFGTAGCASDDATDDNDNGDNGNNNQNNNNQNGTPKEAGKIPDLGEVKECDDGGNTFFYVLNTLDIARKSSVPDNAGANVLPGIDLDGVDNSVEYEDDQDANCAKQQDWVYPNATMPTHTGIDNQVGVLIEDVANILPIDISGLIEDAIASGELLVLLRLKNVDADIDNPGNTDYFPTDDDCVNADLVLGALPPDVDEILTDENGLLSAGQMFAVLNQSLEKGEPAVQIKGATITGGVFRGTSPVPFKLEIPNDDDVDVPLDIQAVSAEFVVDATTISDGLMGGILDVKDTAQGLSTFAGIKAETIEPILENFADMNPNQSGTACQDVSVGFVYTGVDAIDTGMTL